MVWMREHFCPRRFLSLLKNLMIYALGSITLKMISAQSTRDNFLLLTLAVLEYFSECKIKKILEKKLKTATVRVRRAFQENSETFLKPWKEGVRLLKIPSSPELKISRYSRISINMISFEIEILRLTKVYHWEIILGIQKSPT